MKYFITGATGFIGRHLVRRLIDSRANTVHCLVRNEGKLAEDIRGRIALCQGDGSSLERHARIIQSCDVIFHLGARADLGDGDAYRRDNIEFTDALIRLARGSKKLRRFVFTSTIGAVDRTKDDPCTAPLVESSTPNPISDYGKSKLACEEHLAMSGLPHVILRPALVYGPGMRHRSHLRVFIDAVEKEKPFTKFNFPGRLSFIHVDDLVDALLITATHPKALRQVYFVADNEPVPLGTLFQELGHILGKSAGRINMRFGLPHMFRSVRPFLPFQAQNLFSDVLTASNTKLRSLGFSPKKNRLDGFRETAHDHFKMEHPERGAAIVTGGASGIGRAMCEQLSAHGYSIILVDRDKSRGTDVARRIRGEYIYADLSKSNDIDRVVRTVRSNAGRISLLVNNAGIGRRGTTEDISASDLAAILAVNCEAPVQLSKAVIPEFIRRGYGTLINIGSSAGYQPLPYMSVYAASKAFIIRYTQALQGELTGRKIPASVEILLASPSGTATDFQKKSGVKEDDTARLLRPEDVADAIIRRIGKGSSSFTIGISGKGMALAARVLPVRLQIWLWERLMRDLR